MNINAIKSKVDAVINQYGTEIKVYRDIYSEDEYGCKNLDENMTYIGTIKGIIDNASSSRLPTKTNERQGIVELDASATLYIPYEKDILVQEDDYLEIDGVYYRVGIFLDIVHYNLLYEIPIERIELNG